MKIALGITIGIAICAFATRNIETRTDCDNPIYATDVPRWIEGFTGKVDYRNGEWYDGNTLVGYSANEDSDVCVK